MLFLGLSVHCQRRPLPPAGVTNLPAGITKLKALASLDVSGCPLAFLPSGLGRLHGLRHLRLNGTNLMVGLMHTWEPLAKLPVLESVELRWGQGGGAPCDGSFGGVPWGVGGSLRVQAGEAAALQGTLPEPNMLIQEWPGVLPVLRPACLAAARSLCLPTPAETQRRGGCRRCCRACRR